MLAGLYATLWAVAMAAADDGGGGTPEAPPLTPTVEPGPVAEPAPMEAEAPPGPTAAAELEKAIDLYLDGEPAKARVALQEILARGPDLPAEVRQEAYAYLGDIVLSEQGATAARNVFETLLAEAPDYVMDPFKHPPEVVSTFEDLRRALARGPSDPQVPPYVDAGPWPWLVILPGGTVYFKERRPVAGILVATTQAAGLGVSLWSRVELQRLQYKPRDAGVEPDQEDGTYSGPFRIWKAVNVVSVSVGWAGYLVPIVVETARWGTAGSPLLEVGPTRLGVRVPF